MVSGLYPYPQDMLNSTNRDPNFMNIIITGDESWVYGYDPETKSFRNFPHNENPTTRALNTTSIKCCLPSTDDIDRREKTRMRMNIQGRLMQARFIQIHQVFAKKNKVEYFSNRVVFQEKNCAALNEYFL